MATIKPAFPKYLKWWLVGILIAVAVVVVLLLTVVLVPCACDNPTVETSKATASAIAATNAQSR